MLDRQEWLLKRRTGIGGSDVAAILGLSKWQTAYDVWAEKRSAELPDEGDGADKPWLYWGQRIEPIIVDEYERVTRRSTVEVPLIRHPEKPHWLANIDRAVLTGEEMGDGPFEIRRILECKTCNRFASDEWGEEGTDEVPEYYLTQVQWYMGVTGAEVCDLAVLIGGSDFRIYTINRDDALIGAIRAQVDAFWNEHVLTGIAPPPQSYDDALKIWPRQRAGSTQILDSFTARDLVELAEISANKSKLEKREDEIKTRVAVAMGDFEVGQHMGEDYCTWKWQKSERIDTKALREAHPDLAALYTKTSETRVLRIKKIVKDMVT